MHLASNAGDPALWHLILGHGQQHPASYSTQESPMNTYEQLPPMAATGSKNLSQPHTGQYNRSARRPNCKGSRMHRYADPILQMWQHRTAVTLKLATEAPIGATCSATHYAFLGCRSTTTADSIKQLSGTGVVLLAVINFSSKASTSAQHHHHCHQQQHKKLQLQHLVWSPTLWLSTPYALSASVIPHITHPLPPQTRAVASAPAASDSRYRPAGRACLKTPSSQCFKQ